MKNFFILTLITIITLIGLTGYALWFNDSKELPITFQYICLFIGHILLLVPAINSWKRYFENLFNNKD
jgi:phosphoglycerol transferase MdoB-like AlkP superfamily enzyme